MSAESTFATANASPSVSDCSSNPLRIGTPDRHQGWHTEFCGFPTPRRRFRRATDYVVRTSFVRDASKSKSSESNRVNLVLRFRSLLSRRTQQHQPHTLRQQRVHKNSLLNQRANRDKSPVKRNHGRDCTLESPTPPAPKVLNLDTFEEYESDTGLKRANSDSCLSQPHNHSHAILLRILNSYNQSNDSPVSATSPVSDQPPDIDGSTANQTATKPSSAHAATADEPSNSTDEATEEGSKTKSQLSRTIQVRRRSSLSTGNICCLYALRCLPSVEYLNTPVNHASPAMRRRSLPASSLKPYPHYDRDRGAGILRPPHTPFALAAMRHHPCYQDVACDLKQWIKRTLDVHESTESVLHGSKKNSTGAGADTHESSEWTRHVRFADEATGSSSATTLNSLSASSSTRSLSSLVLTPDTRSPYGSISSLERNAVSYDEHTNLTNLSSKLAGLHPIPRRLLKKFSRMSTSRPIPTTENDSSSSKSTLSLPNTTGSSVVKPGKSERGEERQSLARFIWRRRTKRHRARKTTPLVTVNVIHDYSEPPVVPRHVLKELEVEEEQPFWQAMFANPEESPQFNQNLYKQRLHLGRLWSLNLSSIQVEVYVVISQPFTNESSPQVRLRYTLDNWHTYAESDALNKMHTEKRSLSPCETFWVEVHSSRVLLRPATVDSAVWNPNLLEFAVVARRNGSEWWDNNNKQNYICHRQQNGDSSSF